MITADKLKDQNPSLPSNEFECEQAASDVDDTHRTVDHSEVTDPSHDCEPNTKGNQEPTKQYVLAFDIDDCLASDLFLEMLCIDEKLQAIFPADMLDKQKSEQRPVIIQSASNRKDHGLDKINKKRNKTYLTGDALDQLAVRLKEYLGKSEVNVNYKLLVEQLCDGTNDETKYTDCLTHIDRLLSKNAHQNPSLSHMSVFRPGVNNQSASALYALNSPAFQQKLDVILALAGQYGNHKNPVEINFYDDRFYDVENSESGLPLFDMVNFIKMNPNLIPDNVTIKFFKLDSYELETQVGRKSHAQQRYMINKLRDLSEKQLMELARWLYERLPPDTARLLTRRIKEESALFALDEIFKLNMYVMSRITRTRKPIYQLGVDWLHHNKQCNDMVDRKLEICMECWMNCTDKEKDNILSRACQHIETITGERAKTPHIKSLAFWQEIMLPAAERFSGFHRHWWCEKSVQEYARPIGAKV